MNMVLRFASPMASSRWAGSLVLACVLVFSLAGCGDAYDGRVEVSGTVMLKGQPLDDAFLSFLPLEEQNTQAQVLVTGGKYRVERRHGLKPGKYLIRVSKGDGKTVYTGTEPPGPGGGNIISKELVPADWNVHSKQERMVTSENPNIFDFDIR